MSGETRLNVALLQTWPVRVGAGGTDAQRIETPFEAKTKTAPKADSTIAAAQKPLIAGELRIELDHEAGRFVVTLTDPGSMEVIRRFPHESQLAYARAVSAYMNARNQLL